MSEEQGPLPLERRALLATLNIKCWGGEKHDAKQTMALADSSNARRDAVSVAKLLLPKPLINPVQNAANALRMEFNEHTAPWSNGFRILPAEAYLDFTDKIRVMKDGFYDAVAAFTGAYEEFLNGDEAKERLGDAFDITDYPTDPSTRFSASVRITPVPSANDWRLPALDGQALGELTRELQDQVNNLERQVKEHWLALMIERLDAFANACENKSRVYRSAYDKLLGLTEGIASGARPTEPLIRTTVKSIEQDIRSVGMTLAIGADRKVRRKAMAGGKAKEDAGALLRQCARKLGDARFELMF